MTKTDEDKIGKVNQAILGTCFNCKGTGYCNCGICRDRAGAIRAGLRSDKPLTCGACHGTGIIGMPQ